MMMKMKIRRMRLAALCSTVSHWCSTILPVKTASDFQSARAARLAKLRLLVEDFEEKFARSSGPGGQHVNKVSTSVTLKHVPTGVAVTVQDSRSQSANRQLAWTRLLDLIETSRREERAALRAAREKERRRNAPRPYGVKKRILENKRRRSETKRSRAAVE
jgi:peptide chain release factor